MSQRKFGVFFLGGRLTRSIATSAFALSALAGGAVVSGGEAKAAICVFPPECSGTYPTEVIPTDKLLTFAGGPSSGIGDVEFKWIDTNGNGTWYQAPADFVDEWHVDVDFNPDQQADSVLSYFIKIDTSVPHLDYFRDATLGSIIGPGTGTVIKDIYNGAGGVQGGFIGSITNSGTFTFTPNTYSELYIVDTVTPGTSTVDSYQNVFRQTPGPLPILGAGAAFGFSRKLRSRIKGVRAA